MDLNRAALFLTILTPLAFVLGGCNPAPRTAESVDQPAELWDARGVGRVVPEGSLDLRSLTVEVVTKNYQSGNERQAAFVVPHPVILAAGAAGVGLKTFEMTDAEAERVADAVADALLETLREAGWSAEIQTTPLADPEFTNNTGAAREDRINLGATDTGRIREVVVIGTLGAPVWSGRVPSEAGAIQFDTDRPAVAFRYRVGIYQGYPTVEQGSEVLVVDRTGAARVLSMDSTLVGSTLVATPESGGTFDVDIDAMIGAVIPLVGQATRGFADRAGG